MYYIFFYKGEDFICLKKFLDNEITVSMNGKTYTYEGDKNTFIEFLFSDSKGKFYNSNIKRKVLN